MENTVSNNYGWLAHWYAEQCTDDWEHSYGIKIHTLDNPGWSLLIDLCDTPMEDVPFQAVFHNKGAPDGDPSERWHTCKIDLKQFKAWGGVFDLGTMIGVFREWVEVHQSMQKGS